MSVKRQATTDLNHENWDQDDPSEQEEMGSFKAAPKDVLEKRVIRTAKRRSQVSANETKKSVFSGFGGFNKTQPSSFDFLANLTNGKNSLSPANKSDTTVTSTIFSTIPISSNSSNGIFGAQVSSPTKPMFGMGTSQPLPMFGSASASPATTSAPSFFTAPKADSTVNDSPVKIQTPSRENNEVKTNVSVSLVSSTMFGATTTNNSSKLFSGTSNSSPFSIKPSATPVPKTNSGSLFTTSTNSVKPDKPAEKDDDKKMTYCVKLKGLNESVSDWIKKNVEETPLCILTPIFKDYEKYLKEIQDEYQGEAKEETKPAGSPFHIQNNTLLPKSTSFTLGSTLNNSGNKSDESKTETPKVIVPIVPTTTAASSSPFSTNTITTKTNGTTPFSFGTGRPFSFNSNVQAPAASEAKNNEDEDAPPKVEYKPIVEENSVYEHKCKIFVKKDDNFVDKGVGTLYIKKIEENDKHQLLVRANTNLGNVMVNLILSSVIPTQRMGKNNVMMVCIPTPDTKPPPVPILIRVKTAEEADELLEMLNKYKS